MAPKITETTVGDLPAELPGAGMALLDVREDNEWQAGHVVGALHIPLGELPQRVDEVPEGQRVVVVCRSGGRSAQATGFLQEHGRDAVNLAGGMRDWHLAGRPMTSESGATPDVV